METEFTRRLQAAMKSQGRTQADLAAATNVSQSQVSKWIRGRNVPDVFQAKAMAKLLRVSVDWLVGDEGESQADSPGVSADEKVILEVCRAMKLDHFEAIRRLTGS